MKTALLYTRVSTTEQADRGYSLRDQESRLRQHCRRERLAVAAHYQDDASAKTFDRPGFQRLLAHVRKGGIDVVLVVKWDRFSRDMTGALGMIEMLRQRGVEVQAAEQPIDVDIPEQRMMLAVYLAAPEVENKRRSLNVIMGMRRAQREGRWVAPVPVGYTRTPSERGRLSADPEKAPLVREAYEMAAGTELPMEEIRRRLRTKGLKIGTNQFTLLLRNPVYLGKIKIKAWRDEPEELVDGLHEAIVPAAVWHRVQERFTSSAHRRNSIVRPEIPLRGHLVCPQCLARGEDRILTGSRSRGNGGTYWYYHCTRGCRERHQHHIVHEAMDGFLRSIEVAPAVQRLYHRVLSDLRSREGQTLARRRAALQRRLDEQEKRLLQVDMRYIEGDLERDSYDRLKATYAAAFDEAQAELDKLNSLDGLLADQLRVAVDIFARLGGLYHRLEPKARHELVGSIFPEKLIFENGRVRTMKPNPLIGLFTPKKAENRRSRRPERDRLPVRYALEDSNL